MALHESLMIKKRLPRFPIYAYSAIVQFQTVQSADFFLGSRGVDWLVDPTKYATPTLTVTTNASRVAMTQFLMVLEGCESFRGALPAACHSDETGRQKDWRNCTFSKGGQKTIRRASRRRLREAALFPSQVDQRIPWGSRRRRGLPLARLGDVGFCSVQRSGEPR